MKRTTRSPRIDSLFLLGLFSLLLGCGSSVMTTAPSHPTQYPFSSAPKSLWLQEFAANDLYIPTGLSTIVTETIKGMATDAQGNVYAAGFDLGSFGGYPNPGPVAEDFITKYNPSGDLQWIYQFGTGSGDFLEGISIDASGNIYATGVTLGSLNGYSNPNGIPQGALYKFTPDGSLLWQHEFAVNGAVTLPASLAIDPSGAVVIGGTLTPINAAEDDLFVGKYDGSTGTAIWQQTFGSQTVDTFTRLVCDATGDIYAIGVTTGPFPGQGTTGPGNPFLLKLAEATGQTVWVTTPPSVPGVLYAVPEGLAIAKGAVVIAGTDSNQFVSFGPGADPTEEAYLASYSTEDGSQNWLKPISSGQGDSFTDVAIAPNGDIFAVGQTRGFFAAGFSQPSQDGMVLQFAADGTDLTALQFGTGLIVGQAAYWGPYITASSAGQIYGGGAVQTPFPGFTNPSLQLQMFLSRVQ